MLTKLYRHGPARQRIWKGFIVAGPDPLERRRELLARTELLSGLGVKFRLDPQRRKLAAVWLDTDNVWLHTPQARNAVFSRLAQAAARARAFLAERKAELLPGTVRLDRAHPWRWYLCGDHHFVEVADDAEREVYCNLLREHLPELLALTARVGAGPEGVEPNGSRRLNDSKSHFTPYFLASASPEFLGRLAANLRRDEGIGRLDSLDVNPTAHLDGVAHVELRFVDSQALAASVRAQALLFEALFVRARRLVRAGMRPLPTDQGLLEQNRILAVTEGVDARLGTEPPGRRDRRRRAPRTQPVLERFLQLIKSLRYELAVLEATYDELAPLLLGAELRLLGHGGLVNENDLFRWLHRQAGKQLPRQAGELPAGADRLTAKNQEAFAQASAFVRRSWEDLLRGYDKELAPADRRDELEAFFGDALPPEARQKRKRARDEEARLARLKKEAETRATQPKKEPPPPRPPQPRYEEPDPYLLHDEVTALPEEADRLGVLLNFVRITNCRDLGFVFTRLPPPMREALRRAIRPPDARLFRLTPGELLWDDPGALDAIAAARAHGSAMLSIRVPVPQGREAERRVGRMGQSRPEGVEAFLFYAGPAGKQAGIDTVCFDQLLVSRSEEAPS